MSIKYKIEQFINYLQYNVPQGLRNLIEYAPVIWNTREWDQNFLYDLIVFKLKKMESYFYHKGIATDSKKQAGQIRKAYQALTRVSNDEYPGFKKFCRLSKKQRDHVDYSKEFLKDEKLLQKDLKLFVDYFLKYSRTWWD